MKIKNNKSIQAPKVAMAVLVTLVVGISPQILADPKPLDRARAELRTLNNSGISGELRFRSNGSELIARGKAKGMDPNGFYISLYYDILSVATGDFACEPGFDFSDPFLGATADAPGRLTLFEMGIDSSTGMPLLIWVPTDDHHGDGKRTVHGAVDVDLDRVRTFSIRDASINDGIGPLAVVACGVIVPED